MEILRYVGGSVLAVSLMILSAAASASECHLARTYRKTEDSAKIVKQARRANAERNCLNAASNATPSGNLAAKTSRTNEKKR
ncbi:hypothetical protein PAN31117_05072 [Pandoraea anapnoica]|uniref:Uncharacterized protein n=1 Tax=Pandoraea anapnoica TaxID=2508301 RepID=A0A5E5ANQ8_9BURK|nr:hypothetical protein PIN31009_05328 [Pandoraea iniqua]VVE75064.1 hypothetical protein PAN31117_05072 [Pandoraea anapnoica]